jgi:hypothetical protein
MASQGDFLMNIIDIPQTTIDLISYRINGTEPWPDPVALTTKLEPVPRFNPELLPPVLREYVLDAAHRMQAPVEFGAVSALASLGSIIGTACGVRPKACDNWTVVPNIWGCVIGGPTTKKTPGQSVGQLALVYLEHDAQHAFESAVMHHKLAEIDRKDRIKQLQAKDAAATLKISADEVAQQLKDLQRAELPPPTLTRYRCNDATIEKLGELARDNPRGLMVYRDELAGLLEGCSRQGHEGDRSFYLEAWNGQYRYVYDRIGRGTIIIPRLCLSILGGIQPAKLQYLIAGTVSGYENDGLLQRFQLMVYPDVPETWQYVDEAPNEAAMDMFIKIGRTLASTDFLSWGATKDTEQDVPYFRFTPSAQKVFIKWITELENGLRKMEHPVMAEHMGKYTKLVPALALIFHLVDLAVGERSRKPGITKEALERAIKWAEFLVPHAYRVYALALDPVQTAAHALAEKLKAGELADGFSVREVYKSGWSDLTDRDAVQAALDELEQDAWIRRMPARKGTGRPSSPTYLINPKILGK